MSYTKDTFLSGSRAQAIPTYQNLVYIPKINSYQIYKYNISKTLLNTYTTSNFGNYASGISQDGTTLYTIGGALNNMYLAIIDTSTNTVTSENLITGLSNPQGKIYVESSSSIWIYDSNSIVNINPLTSSIIAGNTISLGFVARDVVHYLRTSDNTHVLYTCNLLNGNVYGYNQTTKSLLYTVTGLSGLWSITIGTINGVSKLYLGSTSTSNIYEASLLANTTATLSFNSTITGMDSINFGKYNSTNTFYISDGSTNTIYSFTNSDPAPICFREGSQILCQENGEEIYRPIESLRSGDLVKTLKDGYRPIKYIAQSTIYNPSHSERIKSRLYKLTSDKYPEIFQDLYLTGCHSILVDELSETQEKEIREQFGRVFVTDDKYRLMACVDERAEPFTEEGVFNIYHFSLESPDYRNYGVYANGLLVETTFTMRLLKDRNMKIIMDRKDTGCECVICE